MLSLFSVVNEDQIKHWKHILTLPVIHFMLIFTFHQVEFWEQTGVITPEDG